MICVLRVHTAEIRQELLRSHCSPNSHFVSSLQRLCPYYDTRFTKTSWPTSFFVPFSSSRSCFWSSVSSSSLPCARADAIGAKTGMKTGAKKKLTPPLPPLPPSSISTTLPPPPSSS